MDKLCLNENFLIIEKSEDQQILILQNKINQALIKIHIDEYEILKYFKGNSTKQNVIDEIQLAFEINYQMLDSLLLKAVDCKLLIDENYIDKPKDKDNKLFSLKILFIIDGIINFLNRKLNLNILPEYQGNYVFYKVFSININNTFLEKLLINRLINRLLLFSLIAIFCISIIKLFFLLPIILPAKYGFSAILVLVIIIFLSLFLHELAHWSQYKLLGGESGKIGFGFMYGFFPVFYTNTVNIEFWDSKFKKIWVSFSGILFDITLTFAVRVLLSYQLNEFLYASLFLFYYYLIIRVFTNLNFFIPGTDGYYIFTDIFNIKRLQGKAFEALKEFWFGILQRKLIKLNIQKVLLIIYYLISFIIIILYLLSLLVLLFSPLLIKLIK